MSMDILRLSTVDFFGGEVGTHVGACVGKTKINKKQKARGMHARKEYLWYLY